VPAALARNIRHQGEEIYPQRPSMSAECPGETELGLYSTAFRGLA
jgi:hypothetical protein